jgi:tetratricopeptide (TPR) repeat protein
MLNTRLLLIIISSAVIGLLFLLPKAVVENDNQLEASAARTGANRDKISPKISPNPHTVVSKDLTRKIKGLRDRYLRHSQKEKNAIFADSLATLYRGAQKFDSAAWFADEASTFFNTTKSFLKAGDNYYDAFTFTLDPEKQRALVEKCRFFYDKVLTAEPQNLEVKTKTAMTYVSSSTPMKGILMLREVLTQDPKNQLALFDMGMLSIQSGQYDRAIERLKELVSINEKHTQGQLLLGLAYLNKGDKANAKAQFEKVKQLDNDPSVQATADSYLNDLK